MALDALGQLRAKAMIMRDLLEAGGIFQQTGGLKHSN